MMEIVFNIFVINKSSRVKIYKEYNTNKYACKSRQCARSSRPGACPLRRARTDPNPLPRKRRDPGWGRPEGGAAVTPHRRASSSSFGSRLSSPARVQGLCADGLWARGAHGLGWRRDSRAAPTRPARGHLCSGLSPAIKRASRPG
jgi:hypothetical protein